MDYMSGAALTAHRWKRIGLGKMGRGPWVIVFIPIAVFVVIGYFWLRRKRDLVLQSGLSAKRNGWAAIMRPIAGLLGL